MENASSGIAVKCGTGFCWIPELLWYATTLLITCLLQFYCVESMDDTLCINSAVSNFNVTWCVWCTSHKILQH